MLRLIVSFVLIFVFWVLLTGFNQQELILGLIVSFSVSFLTRKIFIADAKKFLNPIRWFYFFIFVITFFINQIIANIEMVYRIILGNIYPRFVSKKFKLKSEIGKVALANSITFTPGTISVFCDKNLLVHSISSFRKINNEKFLRKAYD